MARQMFLPSDPKYLLQYMDDLDSDSSDEEFDGYIEDDEETIRRRDEDLHCGNEVNGVSDEQDRMDCDDGLGNTGDKRGADDMVGEGEGGEMAQGGDTRQGRENEQGEIEGGSNGSEDDSDSDANTQNASSGIPVFSENVGVVPDMTGKQPVDY